MNYERGVVETVKRTLLADADALHSVVILPDWAWGPFSVQEVLRGTHQPPKGAPRVLIYRLNGRTFTCYHAKAETEIRVYPVREVR